MPDERGRSRLNFEVTQDVYDRAMKLIPWGWRKSLWSMILDQLLTAIEVEGLTVAALIIEGKLTLFGRRD